MCDPFAPVIEGVDLSGIVNRYSFQCDPFFTEKSESSTMLDGSTVHDVFPLKARFSWALNSLSARQYAALDAALLDTVTATIFDPTINATRSGRFHVTRPTFVFNFVTHDYMSTAGSSLILEDAAPRTLSAAPLTRPVPEPRDPLAPVIGRYDLSGIVNQYSLQCDPFTTDGENGGTLQDGSTIQDVLADKFRLSWTLNAISAQQYADLCAVLSSGTSPDTVSASVYNPVLRAKYTTLFHVSFPAFRFAFVHGQSMAYADSILVLEETSPKRGLPVAGDDDWTLLDDGVLIVDPLPDGGDEADRWRRILDDLDDPPGDPDNPIGDVDRIRLNPGVPSLPPGVIDQFPNLDDVVIPPDVEIDPDAFDDCPALTVVRIVAFPFKTDYIVGENLDYNGLRVVEISGDTETDITPECVLLPAEGYTTTVVEDIMVDVRYHDKSLGTFWVSVAASLDLRSIYVARTPRKTAYDFGETLDYTGIIVTGVRTDWTTMDVTSFCTFSPKNGETVPYPDSQNPDVEAYRQITVDVWCADRTCSFTLSGPTYSRHFATGTSRLIHFPDGNFDTFVGRFSFRQQTPPNALRFVEFEYGLSGSELQKAIRFFEATEEEQSVYHVVQIPEAIPLQDFVYNMYLYEPNVSNSGDRAIRFDSFFMVYPYADRQYPGRPELVRDWIARTFR